MNIARKSILEKGRGRTRKLAKLEYLYEKESLYFVQAAESVKDLVLEELKNLNGQDLKPVFRGVWFKASKADFYRIVYGSRLVSRVLAPLATFPCRDKDDLYKAAKKIHWEEFLTLKTTFSINANVSESSITHSNFAGLRVKDAIADYFRDRTNKRPSVDAHDPYIMINLHIHRDVATLSIDASGGPLHKRGYREETVAAPMQETVAAAIVRLSGWDGSLPLYDPMCGSGTLLCEALMSYCRVPAQVFRTGFGFERLPDFDPDLWERVKAEAREAILALPENLLMGSDISEHSVHAARTNLMGLHHGGRVEIQVKDFQEIPAIENSLILTNPPYGIRMGKGQDMNLFYQKFGMFLRERCRGSQAYVYFGEPRFIKKMPLAPSWKRPLKIGGLDGKLVKYELY
ncbi:THUMP domain-containing class I SAM-dependent RNA methyltransferase [Desulfospira joergensenii]|uniref:THUMP domain-containing class I SAM-dependent RNA methyltransferase n=1 Tax=Desulfospira joergensenii TaxID=53329 RepID=UPI0003B7A90F|nr:THUMP domain-containing protein [Desulfospira joergensenii]